MILALSMAEVAEKLSTATGKTIRCVNVSPEDAKKAQLAAGMPSFIADALAELFAERRNGKESQVSSVIPTVFGRAAISFDEFAGRKQRSFAASGRRQRSDAPEFYRTSVISIASL
jgi:hypothetical protein